MSSRRVRRRRCATSLCCAAGGGRRLRRCELSALQWRDLVRRPDGHWVMLVRRSKTDQSGRGVRLYLPRVAEERASICIARALDGWHEHVKQHLGRDPRLNAPTLRCSSASTGSAVCLRRGVSLKVSPATPSTSTSIPSRSTPGSRYPRTWRITTVATHCVLGLSPKRCATAR
jgi:hypothetical protein